MSLVSLRECRQIRRMSILSNILLPTDSRLVRSLSRDLVLPLWKSNVSVSLMIDKKAKRCGPASRLHFSTLLTFLLPLLNF